MIDDNQMYEKELFKTDVIEKIKNIVGENRILRDFEDLYVYSFEKILDEKYKTEFLAVVKSSDKLELELIEEILEKENIFKLYRENKKLQTVNNQCDYTRTIFIDNVSPIKLSEKLSEYENNIKKNKKEIDLFKNDVANNLLGASKRTSSALRLFLDKKLFRHCQDCEICTGYCTVAPFFNHIETWSSKGRYLLTKGLMNEEISLSKKLIDVIYSCTLCGSCFMQCTKGLEIDRAIINARRYIAEKELAPKTVQVISENVKKTDNPFGLPKDLRTFFLDDLNRNQMKHISKNNESDLLFWVGCNTAFRAPEIACSVIDILSKLDISVNLLGEEEGCCGSILVFGGFFDSARKNAEMIIKKISNTGASTIITSCAGCYEAFNLIYPEFLDVKLPFRVLHTSQFLDQLNKEGILTLQEIDMKVTYQDPCSLGRHCHVYDAPRNILKSIPGLELREMPQNKEYSRCCGGGGGLYAFNNDASIDSSHRLTQDVVSMGLNKIVTTCPQCYTTLRILAKKWEDLRIFDLSEIVSKSLKT